MSLSRVLIALATALVLAGCRTVAGPEQYSIYRQALIGSPAFRAQEHAKCVDGQLALPTETRRTFATIINVPYERSAQVTCDRTVKAIVSGRMDYATYTKIVSGQSDGETLKLFQGL